MEQSTVLGMMDIPQPAWLDDALEQMPKAHLDHGFTMRRLLELARLNGVEHRTGLPLAGALMQANGVWVGGGVEFVGQGGSRLAHPAMVAINVAFAIYRERLFRDDAPGKEIPELHYFGVSVQCSRCLRALAQVRRLTAMTLAATAEDVHRYLQINTSPPPSNWQETFQARGTTVLTGFMRGEARALFASYQSLQ